MSEKGADPRKIKLRPPTDEDWARVIYRFRLYRGFATKAVLRRAKALPAVLEAEASALCDIADEVDRTLDTRADLSTYRASVLLGRIEGKGYTDDMLWSHVRDELIQHLLEPVERSPSSLRQRAFALRDASEDAQATVDQYTGYAESLRGSRGPSPSVAMYTLFETTDRWRSSIVEIARRFVAASVQSESDADEPDPAKKWQGILKTAQARARELRKERGTG